MSNDNQAAEENNSPEGQEAPELKTPEPEAEKTKSFRDRVCEIDETASVMEDDGEISKILEALYDACQKKHIPIFVNLVYKITKGEEGFDIEARGMEGAGENNFYPPNLMALKQVTKHKALSDLVLHVANDETKMGVLDLLQNLESLRS